MKNKVRAAALTLALVFTLIFSGCGNTGNNYSDITVWNGNWENPVKLIYTQRYEIPASYETNDEKIIADIVNALKGVSVSGETDIYTTDSDDVVTFVFSDNSEYTVTFENGNYVSGVKRYTVENFSQIKKLLLSIAEEN